MMVARRGKGRDTDKVDSCKDRQSLVSDDDKKIRASRSSSNFSTLKGVLLLPVFLLSMFAVIKKMGHVELFHMLQEKLASRPLDLPSLECNSSQCPTVSNETVKVPLRWKSCSPDNMFLCTHHELSYNLFSNNDPAHFLIEDLLNILIYKPERVCNAKYPLLFRGFLDYEPEIVSTECDEDFLYFGFHQHSRLNYQVQNRVRLSKYTEAEMQMLYKYIANLATKCSEDVINSAASKSNVMYINRDRDRQGGNIPKEAIVPTEAYQLVLDIVNESLFESMCKLKPYKVVVVPHSAEMVLPIVMGKPIVVITNDHITVNYYFHESMAQTGVASEFLHMDHEATPNKLSSKVLYNFKPTASQIAELQMLVSGKQYKKFSRFPFSPKGRTIKGGLIDLVRRSRNEYLTEKGRTVFWN